VNEILKNRAHSPQLANVAVLAGIGLLAFLAFGGKK
jgi:hypothetical protein